METIRIFLSSFLEFFLVSGKSHSAEKCKRGNVGVFEHPFFCKGDPLETLGKLCEKRSQKAEKNPHKKFWSRAGLEPMSFCLTDLKKAVTSMPSVPVEVVWLSLVLVHVNLINL